ncbi:MAG: DUF4388 domain-containing protein [Aquificae bacterium]|nr:DUF4388 domain-containing protein [Aquificota bacterium]
MALTGDLKSFSFADILQVLHSDKKSGVLIVEWKDLTVAYYIKEGEVVLARPVDKVFRVYTDRDFERLLEKLRLNERSLAETIKKFLLPRLDNREGIFSFTQGFIKYPEKVPVYFPAEYIIMEAARRLTLEETERKISDELLVFEKTQDWESKVQRANLTDKERLVLELIDGTNTVKDLLEKSKLDKLTLYRTLYGLLSIGAIRRKKKKVARKPSISLDLLAKLIEKIKKL